MELRNIIQSKRHERLQEAESLPTLLLEATDYLRLLYREQSLPASQFENRLAEIYLDYRNSRTYWQTEEELVYGAKVAWRNSSR